MKREEIIELEYEEKITGLENILYGQMSDYKMTFIDYKRYKIKQRGNKNKAVLVIDCQPLQHEIRGIGRYGANL